MSIDSIASSTWARPFASQSGVGGVGQADPPPPPNAGGTIQDSPSISGSTSAVGIANPFQQLASDVQALLVQAQGGTAPTTATSATGTTTGAGPEQQVATDLQTLMAQLQAGHTGSDPNAQAGTTGQTGATSQAQPHHHHHHHGGGTGAGMDAATQIGATSASSATTASAATSAGTAASASDQTTSRAFAADILQALQAYGSKASGAAVPGLTA